MAEQLRIIIEGEWTGAGEVRQARVAFQDLGDTADRAGQQTERAGQQAEQGSLRWANLAGGVFVAEQALQAVAAGAEFAYDNISRGADLDLAAQRFGRLAGSINTTADALLGSLRQATAGMVSDAELINTATTIIETGLADTEDGVVRLATVIGELGLDMQQVLLTMANDSKARLDSLGLSISDVEARAQEFVAAGKDASEAFDLAVLEALEDRLARIGSAAGTTAGDIDTLEAAWANFVGTAQQEVALDISASVSTGDISDLPAQATAVSEVIFSDLIPALDVLSLIALPHVRAAMAISGSAIGAQAEQNQRAAESFDEIAAGASGADRVLRNYRDAAEEATEATQETAAAVEDSLPHWSDLVNMTQEQIQQGREWRTEEAKRREAIEETTQALIAQADPSVIGGEATDMDDRAARTARAAREAAEGAREYTEALIEARNAERNLFAGDFISALQRGADGTTNWTHELLLLGDQMGLTDGELAILARATGEYSEDQIQAALNAAEMRNALDAVSEAMAQNATDISTAATAMELYQEIINGEFDPQVDTSSLTEAERRALALLEQLGLIEGTYDVTINLGVIANGLEALEQAGVNTGGLPTGVVPQQFGGVVTGGTPGRDSVLSALMPGEVVIPTSVTQSYPGGPDALFADIMAMGDGGMYAMPTGVGPLPAGGGYTIVDNSTHTTQIVEVHSREAAALALASADVERRRRMSDYMGANQWQ